ncbi:pyrroline-5-carboxylate reductase [Pseudopelagicola sp. nBUS_19]|uniref:pyrroline-5-carboxylate reductase n=1 Tax=unclassified Pseudopelagicola TaxID=2649563 RepID=UPI003EBC409A
MDMNVVADRGLVLLGCGKMGSAMLQGWLADGLPPTSVWVKDPFPSDWLKATAVNINLELPKEPAIVLVAVKPQMMAAALPSLKSMGNGRTLFVSVAAGISIANYEEVLGESTPVVRAMPNTPAAVGKGITAVFGNVQAGEAGLVLAETLIRAVGQVVRLDRETQMDAVTGVSGSGPAYVFHLIETLAAAGETQGLDPSLAMALAKATVAGAGALAEMAEETPETLRKNVTSPNGTTEAGLAVLMDPAKGLPPLMIKTVGAASERSRELANG